MAEQEGIKLFGFEIKRSKKKEDITSIVPPRDDEGGSYATVSGSHYGQYLNLGDDDSKDNYQLIMKYRGNAMHPEVDAAIEDIVNEAITGSELEQTLDVNLEEVETSDSIKKSIKEEFDNTKDYNKTLTLCHSTVGKAILNTSITIVFGFSILVLSKFIPTIYFGIFTGLAMLLAMISVLTLLPSLILIIKPFKNF